MGAIYYWASIANVIARNAVPLVGILVDHWAIPNVLTLYFIDTLLAIGVVCAALATTMSPAADGTIGRRVRFELTAIVVAALVCGILTVPLAMPLGIALASQDFSIMAVLRDRSLRIGALVQCAFAAWSYVGLRRALRSHSPESLRLKQRFGIVLMRWAAVLGVCYFAVSVIQDAIDTFDLVLPKGAVLFLLVLTYVVLSIIGEIAPYRLLEGTPAAEANTSDPRIRPDDERRNSAKTAQRRGR